MDIESDEGIPNTLSTPQTLATQTFLSIGSVTYLHHPNTTTTSNNNSSSSSSHRLHGSHSHSHSRSPRLHSGDEEATACEDSHNNKDGSGADIVVKTREQLESDENLRKLVVATVLCLGFFAVEVIAGVWS
ncbi:hypothetical protein HDU97_009517, partial [Phlyctochytrium planicorne]